MLSANKVDVVDVVDVVVVVVSHDVAEIQFKKLLILLRFYFHDL